MSWITSITLPNPGPVLPTFIVIQYSESEYGFDISGVEMYADQACKHIITDFCVEELPRELQDRIYECVTAKRDQQRRDRRRLLAQSEVRA
jgi:hypothetical protein